MRLISDTILLPESYLQGKKPEKPAGFTGYLLDTSENQRRPAIIICPGGAYEHLSMREGEAIAMQYLSMGYHAFVLSYSLRPACFPIALQELALLVARLRCHEYNQVIDSEKIIVSGFSAGGHLACSLGAFWNQEFLYKALSLDAELIRPDGMILGYPVITAGEHCHRGSMENLLGECATQESFQKLVSLEEQVGPHTPKTFLWHTVTDPSVPVQSSMLLAEALIRHHVSLELHLYPVGCHGLALATRETADNQDKYIEPQCQSWIPLVKQWIEHSFSD